MRIFAIKNESDFDNTAAYLFYYEKKRKFFIELPDDADEWKTPLILSSFVRKKQKTVNSHWSKIWVQQRIVPPDRQNLGQILIDNNLSSYDEFSLLMLSNGRCAQDDFYLEPVQFDELPEEIKRRNSYKIDDIMPLENQKLLIFFSDGTVKVCDIKRMVDKNSSLEKLLTIHPEYFEKVRLQVGGYGVFWDENMTISDSELFENGKTVPFSKEDFCSFVSNRVVNTAEATEFLGCSRQNIDDLIKRGKLKPIKETEKGKLFLKSDIEKREWE